MGMENVCPSNLFCPCVCIYNLYYPVSSIASRFHRIASNSYGNVISKRNRSHDVTSRRKNTNAQTIPREMPDCASTLTWYFITGIRCSVVRDYKQSLLHRSIPRSRDNPRRPKSCSNARSDVPRRRGTEYIKETHSRSHFGDTVRKRARTHTHVSFLGGNPPGNWKLYDNEVLLGASCTRSTGSKRQYDFARGI